MSKAFCCDRCGKLYKEEEKGRSIILSERPLLLNDLCKDCSNELMQWLDNEVYFIGHKEEAADAIKTD